MMRAILILSAGLLTLPPELAAEMALNASN